MRQWSRASVWRKTRIADHSSPLPSDLSPLRPLASPSRLYADRDVGGGDDHDDCWWRCRPRRFGRPTIPAGFARRPGRSTSISVRPATARWKPAAPAASSFDWFSAARPGRHDARTVRSAAVLLRRSTSDVDRGSDGSNSATIVTATDSATRRGLTVKLVPTGDLIQFNCQGPAVTQSSPTQPHDHGRTPICYVHDLQPRIRARPSRFPWAVPSTGRCARIAFSVRRSERCHDDHDQECRPAAATARRHGGRSGLHRVSTTATR